MIPSKSTPLLEKSILPVSALKPRQRERMFELFDSYFANVDRQQFEADLDEKDEVLVLTDPLSGEIEGFSTIRVLRTVVEGEPIAAVYSGDTIIRPEHWAELNWMHAWMRHAMQLAEKQPESVVYWLFVTCTYKSYRFLHAFAKEYYPRPEASIPHKIRRHRDALIRLKYPEEYEEESAIVRPQYAKPLRGPLGEIPAKKLLDPHVAYFYALNPHYAAGEFLVCITEMCRSNCTRRGLRLVDE